MSTHCGTCHKMSTHCSTCHKVSTRCGTCHKMSTHCGTCHKTPTTRIFHILLMVLTATMLLTTTVQLSTIAGYFNCSSAATRRIGRSSPIRPFKKEAVKITALAMVDHVSDYRMCNLTSVCSANQTVVVVGITTLCHHLVSPPCVTLSGCNSL